MSIQEYKAICPYCGEGFTTLIDLSPGDQQYIEDCQICCRPILFNITLDINSETTSIELKTENE